MAVLRLRNKKGELQLWAESMTSEEAEDIQALFEGNLGIIPTGPEHKTRIVSENEDLRAVALEIGEHLGIRVQREDEEISFEEHLPRFRP